MRDQSNRNRRADIKRALKAAKTGDVLELEALAIIWGTAKSRFVTVRNTIVDFPQPMPGQGNKYVYPAQKALQSMLDHETRHDDAAKAREARTNAILGNTRKRGGDEDAGKHSVNELATLSRLSAEIEEREREQGEYVAVAEVAAVMGDVFSEISEFMAALPNKMDPNGLLPPELRTMIGAQGKEALLQFHRKMKQMLDPDAKPRSSRTAPRRSRKART